MERDIKRSSFSSASMRNVCISEVIYQFVINQEHVIAAIDVKSENFEIITWWYAFHWVVTYELLEVNDKLGVIYHGCWIDGFFDLWIFKKTQEKEWHRHMIRFPSMWKNVVSRPTSSYMSGDAEIVFVLNLYSVALCSCYDVNTKIRRELGIKQLPEKTNIKGIYSYIERLVM
ncbi:F-box protein At5g65850-like [Solanum pennellii]|uniref:F-box protein At5g65850-like n=1 Tax=Solanum pennellii TaxID=28526 RepID=A0ABM1GU68_SOLPN|nr:F-box protein At5g65850-like [Solanum pennellii]